MSSLNLNDWHYLDISELAPLLKRRALSPVELVRSQLDRIEALDSRLHAYARVMAYESLAAASEAETEIARGRYRGPLHGIPVAVKDLFWTRGVVTAAGTTVHGNFVPDEDATVVKRLRDAGAIIIGKLQLTEGAFATPHPSSVPPVNPWGANHWTGASSSGSAVATSAGLCVASLGTDTGGSIRFPCAANGLTGLKPSWGRVSRHGVFELAATLDHVGPMARSARDVAIMFAAIDGPDVLDPSSLPGVPSVALTPRQDLKGVRVGVDPAWNARATDDETLKAMGETLTTLRDLGAELVEVVTPESWHVAGTWEVLCGVQTAVAHAETYPARASEYGPALSRLIDVGRAADGMTYQRAILEAIAFRGRMSMLLESIDMLVAPVQPFAAPTYEQLGALAQDPELNQRLIQFTSPFNVSGHPALALPCGMTAGGMPIGCQLLGRRGSESALIAAGEAFQRVTRWHRMHPPV
ncbi:amidase [Azoarcus sp. L1K30]|uniref:amidase n=1 Tax=Azoarcus sp. L1K30 TaxID=2820277 RepID=UPI001B8179CE|nr:amidase [Azoarcus sp. L1K30]